jgi:signal transduction histidine kinase
VAEVAEVFEHDLRGRGIDFVIDAPLPHLNCERARFRQVFQNLIDNAIKYMGEGSVQGSPVGIQGSGEEGATESSLNPEPGSLTPLKEIHVGCTVRGDEAEFYVRDTGMGIDPDDRDKVFYVFRRGKGAAVQNVAGKGVGLASVKSIVETYNGSIWVESQPGFGSTFKFTVNGQYVLAPPPAGSAPATGAGGKAA